MKVRSSGIGKTLIYPTSNANYLYVTDEWIVFVDETNVLKKIPINGGANEVISCFKLAENYRGVSEVFLDGEWLYYIDMSNDKMYKIKADCTGLQRVDWVYYYDADGFLNKIKWDGTGWNYVLP